MIELEKRFWSKVDVKDKNKCWNWLFAKDKDGYGLFGFNKKQVRSNRMTWFLVYGVMPKLYVLHICDNSSCCNPNHLFLGNSIDNVSDRHKKRRDARGKNNGMFGKFEKESPSFGKKRISSSSKYFGVSLHRKKWRVVIRTNGKYIHVGEYFSELEAATEYDNYIIKYNLTNPLNFKIRNLI